MGCSHNKHDMMGKDLVGVGVRRQGRTAERSLEEQLGFGIFDRQLDELNPEEQMNLIVAMRRLYDETGDAFGMKSVGEAYEFDAQRRLNDQASPQAVVPQLENAREAYHTALGFYLSQRKFEIPDFAEYLKGRIDSLEQKIRLKAPFDYELRELPLLPKSANPLPEPVLAGR
ncbi:hypothetical protein HYY73_02105 [Candidatus Woesearchaeota archaeon]|nr:hypothetical protein [Candidatus Woesearchaeota archaeon]